MTSNRDELERELDRAADPLSAYWNDLLRPGQAARGRPPTELDPALVETVRRLRRLGDTPAPPAELRDRLWQQLMAPPATAAGAHGPATGSSVGSNGRAPVSPLLWPIVKRGPSGGLWLLGQLALAAILLVTFAGGYLAFRPDRPNTPPVNQPSEDSSADRAAVSTGATVAPLAQGRAAELPPTLTFAGVRRSTFTAGAQSGMKTYQGPNLAYVEAGTVTYVADQPLVVVRATSDGETGLPVEISAGQDAVLTTGDSVLIPLGVSASARNDGTETAMVATVELNGPAAAATSSSGVITQPLSLLYTVYPRELPRAPAAIRLIRVNLDPNGRFAPLPGTAWWLVAILHPTDNTVLERRPDGSIVNLSPTRMSFYLVAVEAAAEGASMP